MTPCPAGRAALSVVGTTAALGAATLAYSLIEARCPVLRRIDVPVLAADEEPLTVLHLADLHLTGRTEARVAWVRQLAQLQPDVVVNTGDNLSLESGLEPLRRALEPLTGLPGAFVMGDHDYRSTVFRLPTRYLHRDPRKASSRVRDEDIEALPWEEIRDRARDLGRYPGWGATRREAAAQLAPHFPQVDLPRFAGAVDTQVFSSGEPPSYALGELWDSSDAIVRSMGAQRSRLGRALARLSPRSLIHPAGRRLRRPRRLRS